MVHDLSCLQPQVLRSFQGAGRDEGAGIVIDAIGAVTVDRQHMHAGLALQRDDAAEQKLGAEAAAATVALHCHRRFAARQDHAIRRRKAPNSSKTNSKSSSTATRRTNLSQACWVRRPSQSRVRHGTSHRRAPRTSARSGVVDSGAFQRRLLDSPGPGRSAPGAHPRTHGPDRGADVP